MNFSMNDLAGLLGGGGQAGGGGGIMQLLGQIFGGGGGAGGGASIQSLLGLLQGGGGAPKGVSNYQQVFTGGVAPNIGGAGGGVDIPPANMGDPFGGIRSEINPGDFNTSPFGLSQVSGFGQNPSFGNPAFGPTQLPTWWTNYPGVGNVPFAVPNTPGGWTPPVGEDLSHHTPPKNPT